MRNQYLTLVALTLFAPFLQAKPLEATPPKLIGAYFYANWCSACKQLEPELQTALEALKTEPFLMITLDVSNKVTQYRSGLLAQAAGIGRVYQETGVKTGFLLLIEAETGEVVDRITKTHGSRDIVSLIRQRLQT
ncbi:thioredoxin domain-containing protein [Pelagicoccus sp. SDUM812003]|uniref:thioredoxin domain-containing protein n=1 Tax=Pelagicoccus sp. SDUM812003 TaxID=3041267 RepID=UPI00280FB273|nr:thioredoxin domain-containing protein [Pelagicoccus sp. SDUM812003]MDQ8203045.1 thioredoxin domain-containing protein [Pelagicoccus sp. SDUM812003]